MIERMLCKVEGFVFGVTVVTLVLFVVARYLDIQKGDSWRQDTEEGGDD